VPAPEESASGQSAKRADASSPGGNQGAPGKATPIQEISTVMPVTPVRRAVSTVSTPMPRLHQPVDWPHIFQVDPFLDDQKRLVDLLKERSPENSGPGSQNYLEIQAAVAEMQGLLAERVHDYPPKIYVHAKKCLASIEYEASLHLEPSGTAQAPTESVAQTSRLDGASRGLSLKIIDPLRSQSFVYEFLDSGKAGDGLNRVWQDLVPAEVATAALALLGPTEGQAAAPRWLLGADACRFAIELAALSGDKDLIDRIAATATSRGRPELVSLAQAARAKIAATSAAPPARLIAVDAMPLEAIRLYRAYLADIRQAVITGNTAILTTMLKSLDVAPVLSVEQKSYLRQVAAWRPVDETTVKALAEMCRALDAEPAGRSVAAWEQMLGLRQSLFNQLDQELTQGALAHLDMGGVQRTLLVLYDARDNG